MFVTVLSLLSVWRHRISMMADRCLIWKWLCRHISVKKNDPIGAPNQITIRISSSKLTFLNSRWRTDAVLEILGFGDNSVARSVIFAKFCMKK